MQVEKKKMIIVMTLLMSSGVSAKGPTAVFNGEADGETLENVSNDFPIQLTLDSALVAEYMEDAPTVFLKGLKPDRKYYRSFKTLIFSGSRSVDDDGDSMSEAMAA